MIIESKITRNDLANKGYWFRKAEELLSQKPRYKEVLVLRRGPDPKARIEPLPGQILYVASTGGKWGKSSQVRYGEPL